MSLPLFGSSNRRLDSSRWLEGRMKVGNLLLSLDQVVEIGKDEIKSVISRSSSVDFDRNIEERGV